MPRSSEAERARRRSRLLKMLEHGRAGTQQEIVRTLRREGFEVTQATVSRDLEDVGAVRRRLGDRLIYALPERNGPPTALGLRVLPQFVRDAVPSGNLVVVRTYPGMAPTVAAVIDGSGLEGAIGTVAGDDTVLVVAAEGVAGRTLAARIRKLAARGVRGGSRRSTDWNGVIKTAADPPIR